MAAYSLNDVSIENIINHHVEDTYELRRIMVRRLQKASRGVPRRQRVLQHQRFIQEWQKLSHRQELWLVQRALEVGPAVAAQAGAGWRQSYLLELAAQVGETIHSAPRTVSARETSGKLNVCAVDFTITRADSQNPQAELFAHQEPLDRAV